MVKQQETFSFFFLLAFALLNPLCSLLSLIYHLDVSSFLTIFRCFQLNGCFNSPRSTYARQKYCCYQHTVIRILILKNVEYINLLKKKQNVENINPKMLLNGSCLICMHNIRDVVEYIYRSVYRYTHMMHWVLQFVLPLHF